MSYTFLTKNNSEGPTTYFAVSQEIEAMKLHETHNNDGIIVGHYNAGDYCLENESSDAMADLLKAMAERFNIETKGIELDGGKLDEDSIEGLDITTADINAFIAEWKDKNEAFTEIKGFEFHDGHNWKTIIVETEQGEPEYSIVEDEELIIALEKAIEDKTLLQDREGIQTYKGGEYFVIHSQFADDFATFEIVHENDYELA